MSSSYGGADCVPRTQGFDMNKTAVGVVAYSPGRWANPVRAAILQCRSRRAETVSEALLLQHRLWRYEEQENPWP
jgi:hypothetical protein